MQGQHDEHICNSALMGAFYLLLFLFIAAKVRSTVLGIYTLEVMHVTCQYGF